MCSSDLLSGREGVERFPQALEQSLESAVTRALRLLDPSVTLDWVKESIALAEEDEVIRARNRTLMAKPEDVKGYFRSQLKRRVAPTSAEPRPRLAPLKSSPADDPYSF